MVYGFGTSTTGNTATGNNNIDALIANRRWASRNVTFSFTSNFLNDYEPGYPNSGVHNATFSPLNATQRAVTRDWMAMYESVSGLNMIELSGANDRHATIRMAESGHPGTAYAYLPGGSVQAGDIFFNRTSYNSPRIGNYAFHTFGHEIGHALGLEHGHEAGGVSNVAMNANRDSMEFSIMTYRSYEGDPLSGGYSNESWGYAQSLMMYDIRAIQQMYGANFNHNSGNTTYSFSTTTGEMFVNGVGQGQPGANRIFRTIWDGNGIDTYDFSNYSTNLNVNLAPGRWSDLDVGGNAQRAYLGDGNYARGHVFNALQYNGDTRSLIENAYGGSGNDRIYGNSANNYLRGNGGNDRIYGYAGNDIIVGGTGNDSLHGGNGRDWIWGGSGNDYVSGGSGDDFMDGGSGIDTVDYRHWDGGGTYNLLTELANFTGYYQEEIRNFENIYTGDGADVVIGTNAANRIYTGAGNDFVSALGGNDYISAGDGMDTVYGGAGNDFIIGGSGDDFMDGGTGIDTVDYRHWNGGGTYNLTSEIASFAGYYNEDIRNFENIYTGNGADIVIGTNDANRIYTNGGNDFISALGGNDVIVAGAGNDYVIGGSGDDYMDGGSGIDTVDYRHWSGGGTYNLSTEIASFAGFYNEEIRNFENINTGAGVDSIIGSTANNRIDAGAGDDTIDAGSGNDYILGGIGNDTIVGGWGNDYLNGTVHAAQGTGERDILVSGTMADTDTFVLGENGRVFYNDQGEADHAVLQDFDLHNFVGDIADRIQLLGSAASYSLSDVSVSGIAGAGIHFAGDLIGIVQNVSAASLNLADTNQFTYV